MVGNKLDLAATKRVVPIERTEEYVARTLGTEFSVHEVSAKDDDGKEYRNNGHSFLICHRDQRDRKCLFTCHVNFFFFLGIEELFLQITRKLVERKQEIERIKRQNAENAITLQQMEDERLQQAQTPNNSSVCCGI